MRLVSACLVVGAATALVASGSLSAQAPTQDGRPDSAGSVTGVLVGRDDGSPVPYGTVSIVQTGEARFTDAQGQFRLSGLVAGTYTVRARQIGYAPTDTTVRVDAATPTATLRMRMKRLPPLLDIVNIEGKRSKECVATGVPDSTVNPGLAAIFAQVRENVDRYRILWDEYPYRYTKDRSMALLVDPGQDSTWHVETRTLESQAERPYRVGAVLLDQVDSAGRHLRRQLFLPTFRDLADTTFLTAHCFSYGGTESDSKTGVRVVRVDFHPARTIQAPDVEGSVFLDADRLVVRRAVFRLTKPENAGIVDITVSATYRELMPLVPVLAETRMTQPLPRTTSQAALGVGSRTMITDDVFNGYAFETLAPGDQPAARPAVAAIPAPPSQPVETAAVVGVLATTDSTATSDSGRFVLRNIAPGAHMLWVRGIGFRPTRRAVTLTSGRPRVVTITVAPALHVLAPVVTTARYPAGFVAVGLDKRIQAGQGTIITFDQIQKRHAVKMSQLLETTKGIHLQTYFDPDARIMSGQGGCVAFMLDGIPQKTFTSHDLDNIASPDEIGAIEIYSPAEAPVGWGGVTPAPNAETIKGDAAPSGITVNVVTGSAVTGAPPTPPVSTVVGGIPEPCSVMAIWTRARLKLTGAEIVAADSGFRATATRVTEVSGTAVFPPGTVPACEPPPPTDATELNIYATLQAALTEDERDTTWRNYTDRVLGALQRTFAFPDSLELPVFGYAYPARPTATNLKPRGLVIAPMLSTVVVFTLGPSGALIEAHLGASSLSDDADTSVLAAVQAAAENHAFPAMPATASGRQSVRFDLTVTTTTPDPAQRPVVVDQIDVPVWPVSRTAALLPDGQPDLTTLRPGPSAPPDSAEFEFVVDEKGQPIVATARAISRTASQAANETYRSFVNHIAQMLPTFHYEPAHVGTCPVRQMTLQPFVD